ncbi:uncharacterized protein LAESUDRAFT_728901 [Laetiporus sulphureus 93-53]|uniref:Uncharacterized protein n=1 Tax=Laetiporus sulphureus 93-53 TaxID=1314785 RepID=A0A165CX01_9APHY|nr:uncharacterized protein LAESUDRAFT_728901 [Laetiporus sulphureus 93-53]KZT03624.1 hypothetical protein LAESUDRAFT_728901 [Laetiporus sulphureus 93-53]
MQLRICSFTVRPGFLHVERRLRTPTPALPALTVSPSASRTRMQPTRSSIRRAELVRTPSRPHQQDQPLPRRRGAAVVRAYPYIHRRSPTVVRSDARSPPPDERQYHHDMRAIDGSRRKCPARACNAGNMNACKS